MAGYFVDSSALVKRYAQEDGTSWVSPSYAAQCPQLYLSGPHYYGRGHRRRKGRTLTSAKASSIFHRFRQHLTGR